MFLSGLVADLHHYSSRRPGPVYTPIQAASRPAEQMEGFGSGSQIGRPGQPSEIAPTYVFLASAEAELYCKSHAHPSPRLFLMTVSFTTADGQIMHPYPLGD